MQAVPLIVLYFVIESQELQFVDDVVQDAQVAEQALQSIFVPSS